MPGRITPLISKQIYHVFNRGINRQPTFIHKRDYQRALETIKFYRFLNPPIKLSKFLRLESPKQEEVLEILNNREKLVKIIGFCLMPNHFHFLLRQETDKGIAKFIGNFQNSYTRYSNTVHQRDGSLFLDQFKAVRIETDEQLMHVSRYIHLNPHTGYVIESFSELEEYQWSSFPGYIKGSSEFVDLDLILPFFSSTKEYGQFVFDQLDYQRELKAIDHLLIETP